LARSGHTIVTFDSTLGRGAGVWRSERWSPQLQASFDVELQFELPAALGVNAELTSVSQARVRTVPGSVELTGRIESIEPDGMGFLRLAADALEMVELQGDSFRAGQWITLRIPIPSLRLYPYDGPPP